MTTLTRPFALPAPERSGRQLLIGVDAHVWPERTELLFTSPKKTPVLIFKLSDEQGAVHDVFARSLDRVADGLEQLQRDQHWLRRRYGIFEEGAWVRLYERGVRGALIAKTLRRCGLRPEDVELRNIPATLRLLEELPVEELYRICCVWFAEVEQDATLPWNSVSRDRTWMRYAHPDIRAHFHNLLGGQGGEDAAYRLFIDLFDVRIEELSWGVVQHWLFFHRSEFARRPFRALTALVKLGLA
jgi:hypothetical protein